MVAREENFPTSFSLLREHQCKMKLDKGKIMDYLSLPLNTELINLKANVKCLQAFSGYRAWNYAYCDVSGDRYFLRHACLFLVFNPSTRLTCCCNFAKTFWFKHIGLSNLKKAIEQNTITREFQTF